MEIFQSPSEGRFALTPLFRGVFGGFSPALFPISLTWPGLATPPLSRSDVGLHEIWPFSDCLVYSRREGTLFSVLNQFLYILFPSFDGPRPPCFCLTDALCLCCFPVFLTPTGGPGDWQTLKVSLFFLFFGLFLLPRRNRSPIPRPLPHENTLTALPVEWTNGVTVIAFLTPLLLPLTDQAGTSCQHWVLCFSLSRNGEFLLPLFPTSVGQATLIFYAPKTQRPARSTPPPESFCEFFFFAPSLQRVNPQTGVNPVLYSNLVPRALRRADFFLRSVFPSISEHKEDLMTPFFFSF